MQQKPCLTQKELARRWTVSHRTLESWRWTGQGPAFMKIGGRIIYRFDDVLAHEVAHLRQTADSLDARVA